MAKLGATKSYFLFCYFACIFLQFVLFPSSCFARPSPNPLSKSLSSGGTSTVKSRNGVQITFEISMENFSCEDFRDPFAPGHGYQGPISNPAKFDLSNGKITSVSIQHVLSSGYSEVQSLSHNSKDRQLGPVSFADPVKMPPESENNQWVLKVIFEGHKKVYPHCILTSCSPGREYTFHDHFDFRFSMPSLTKKNVRSRLVNFHISERDFGGELGYCKLEATVKAKMDCKSFPLFGQQNGKYVPDLFGPLSPGCVEYEFIPAPTSPSVEPEPTTSAVTTTVTPTKEPEPTPSAVTTTVMTSKEPAPTTSAVTTTVMPTTSAVTTTVTSTKSVVTTTTVTPTTTAVTTTVMPTETEVTTTTMETQNTVHYPSTSEISEYEDFEEQSLSDEQLDEQTHQSGTKPVTPYSGVNEPAHMENLAKPSAHDISSHPFEKKQSSSSVLTISSVTLAVPLLSVVLMNPWF